MTASTRIARRRRRSQRARSVRRAAARRRPARRAGGVHHARSASSSARDASTARAVSSGAGPPSVRRTSTKCRGLRISRELPRRSTSSGAPSSSARRVASSADERTRPGSRVRAGDQARRNRVRRPERQPVIAHQRVGQLGQRRPAVAGARLQPLRVELRGRHRRRHQLHGARRVAEHRRTRAAADRPRCRRCRRTACCGRSVTIACAWPSALLPIARACSSATGLRFCGMMLLPCTKPSPSRR